MYILLKVTSKNILNPLAMRKFLLALALLGMTSLAFAGCQAEPADEVEGEETVEPAAEEAPAAEATVEATVETPAE